jgi:tRNA A37 threonylcarbamoyladenosine modification protein TsaB
MAYTFKLTVKKEKSRLALIKNDGEVAVREWEEERDMGRQLFEAIDGILAERSLKPTDISDFIVKTDVSDNFTSVKIAETVAETYRFAVKQT